MEKLVNNASFKAWFGSLLGTSTSANDLDDFDAILKKDKNISEEKKAKLKHCREKRVLELEEMYELETFEKMKKEPTTATINRSARTRTRSQERENNTRVVEQSKGMEER